MKYRNDLLCPAPVHGFSGDLVAEVARDYPGSGAGRGGLEAQQEGREGEEAKHQECCFVIRVEC